MRCDIVNDFNQIVVKITARCINVWYGFFLLFFKKKTTWNNCEQSQALTHEEDSEIEKKSGNWWCDTTLSNTDVWRSKWIKDAHFPLIFLSRFLCPILVFPFWRSHSLCACFSPAHPLLFLFFFNITHDTMTEFIYSVLIFSSSFFPVYFAITNKCEFNSFSLTWVQTLELQCIFKLSHWKSNGVVDCNIVKHVSHTHKQSCTYIVYNCTYSFLFLAFFFCPLNFH